MEALACFISVMDGGNKAAQESVFEQFSGSREETFFDVMRQRFKTYSENSQEVCISMVVLGVLIPAPKIRTANAAGRRTLSFMVFRVDQRISVSFHSRKSNFSSAYLSVSAAPRCPKACFASCVAAKRGARKTCQSDGWIVDVAPSSAAIHGGNVMTCVFLIGRRLIHFFESISCPKFSQSCRLCCACFS